MKYATFLQVAPTQDSLAWIPQIMRNVKKPIIAALNGDAAGGRRKDFERRSWKIV